MHGAWRTSSSRPPSWRQGGGRGDGADDGRRAHGVAVQDEAERQLAEVDVEPREVRATTRDDGGEGPQVAELRERAQPQRPQLEGEPRRTEADLRQPAADPGQLWEAATAAARREVWSGHARTCSLPEACGASTFAGTRAFENGCSFTVLPSTWGSLCASDSVLALRAAKAALAGHLRTAILLVPHRVHRRWAALGPKPAAYRAVWHTTTAPRRLLLRTPAICSESYSSPDRAGKARATPSLGSVSCPFLAK